MFLLIAGFGKKCHKYWIGEFWILCWCCLCSKCDCWNLKSWQFCYISDYFCAASSPMSSPLLKSISKKKIELQKVLRFWINVQLSTSNFLGLSFLTFSEKKNKTFCSLLFQAVVTMQIQSNCTKKAEVVTVGLFRILSKVRWFTMWLFKKGSGKTVSLQPMGVSLSSEAKSVTFLSL